MRLVPTLFLLLGCQQPLSECKCYSNSDLERALDDCKMVAEGRLNGITDLYKKLCVRGDRIACEWKAR